MQELPIIAKARSHGNRVAYRTGGGDRTYADLLRASAAVAAALLGERSDLAEERVPFLAPAGFEYTAIQWGVWRAGGIAVPVGLAATAPELAHLLGDSGATRVVATSAQASKLDEAGVDVVELEAIPAAGEVALPALAPERRAMILYTSGTTSRPKGVVLSHANLAAQITTLVEAWEWRRDDSIPLFLPMHHIHGIVNVAACALWSGATIRSFDKFDLEAVLGEVAAGDFSLFMAVPTIYAKIIQALEDEVFRPEVRERILAGFRGMRLMVSGSAALPAGVHRRWSELTGQRLLERYGMTETGMILSHPLHGERRPGTVGQPLPRMEVRMKSETGALVTAGNEPGEIQVRGPGVFREYWNLPEATAAAFDEGWFRTGDLAVVENGQHRIMGRLSSDIIKSGGYKLSALEIEAALLDHPAVRECAVVGLPDETWGEIPAAAIVPEDPGNPPGSDALRDWCRGRLSHYKLPRSIVVVPALPRNAMGKVTKGPLRDSLRMAAKPG